MTLESGAPTAVLASKLNSMITDYRQEEAFLNKAKVSRVTSVILNSLSGAQTYSTDAQGSWGLFQGFATNYCTHPSGVVKSNVLDDGFISCKLPHVVTYTEYANKQKIYTTWTFWGIGGTVTAAPNGEALPYYLEVNYDAGQPLVGITTTLGVPNSCVRYLAPS